MTDGQQKQDRSVRVARIGVVLSDKRDKTRCVAVEYLDQHSKYGKRMKRRSRFQVHDPENKAKVGDRVEIAECRPISKTKSWRLVRVVEAAPVAT